MSPSRQAGILTRGTFRTASTRSKGQTRRFRRPARYWCSSFAESYSREFKQRNFIKEEYIMQSSLNRRQFIHTAITAGAGLLSAGRMPIRAQESAKNASRIALPAATKDVTPFKVHVPQAALDDLKRRLASTRWPERETVGDWSQGVPLQKAQALIAYWRDKYDWRRFEARINAFPQYRTQIDGVGIHFIHVRSPQQNALPIILTHGWPGSVVEFMEVIGPLSDPARYGGRAEDAFHVVVPSLPGLGASAAPGPDRGPCELAVRLSRKAAGETDACRAASHRRGIAVRQRLERLF